MKSNYPILGLQPVQSGEEAVCYEGSVDWNNPCTPAFMISQPRHFIHQVFEIPGRCGCNVQWVKTSRHKRNGLEAEA